jgi:hypothetical protein
LRGARRYDVRYDWRRRLIAYEDDSAIVSEIEDLKPCFEGNLDIVRATNSTDETLCQIVDANFELFHVSAGDQNNSVQVYDQEETKNAIDSGKLQEKQEAGGSITVCKSTNEVVIKTAAEKSWQAVMVLC